MYLAFMKICSQSIDFVNKMKYNEYTNIDKLIYQINQVAQAFD